MRKNKKIKVGLPPGTLVYSGTHTSVETHIDILDYNEKDISYQQKVQDIDKINEIPSGMIRFVHVRGLTNIQKIEHIGQLFNIHPLVLEDIVSTTQRPKADDYEDYLYLVFKRIMVSDLSENAENDQISIILGQKFVIIFQESDFSIFDPIYDRLLTPKGKIRSLGADYLAYTLIDVIIDTYFLTLEHVGMQIENLEDEVMLNSSTETLEQIYGLKRKILEFKKYFWPLREVVNKLQRYQITLLSDRLKIYLRDVYDHIFRISDILENYRDLIFGLLELYQSNVSNRMNDIMKVLTIISTVFIPISFLAGFYGMNFTHMPELQYSWSYPVLIGIMFLIVVLMLWYFRRKKWL